MKNTVLVEGHRGYSAKYPENTLISFAAAMDLGVDGVELDIRWSADKVLMVIHDASLYRTCDVDVNISTLTLEQIKALSAHYPKKFGNQFANQNVTVPTLEEFLQLRAEKRPDLLVCVELKQNSPEYIDAVVEMLCRYEALPYCTFFTYDAGALAYVKTKYQVYAMGLPDFQMRGYAADTYSHYDALCISVAQMRSEIFSIYQQKSLPIQVYTADTEADARFCIENGAELVMANDPTALLKLLGRL